VDVTVAHHAIHHGQALSGKLVAVGSHQPAFVVVGDDDVGTLTNARRPPTIPIPSAGRGRPDDRLAFTSPLSLN